MCIRLTIVHALKYVRSKLIELQVEIDESTFIGEDFNTTV